MLLHFSSIVYKRLFIERILLDYQIKELQDKLNKAQAENYKLGADKDKLLADFKQLMQQGSNETIQKLEQELAVLRANRTSQAAFIASLCCYESIENGQGIEVNENHVHFTGNA